MPDFVQETPNKTALVVNFLRDKAFRFAPCALVLGTKKDLLQQVFFRMPSLRV